MVAVRIAGKSYPSLHAFHEDVGHQSVSYNAFYQRIHTGWDRRKAATTPIMKKRLAGRAKRK